MRIDTVLLTATAVVAPAAILVFGACNEGSSAGCEDSGGVLECSDDSTGEACAENELGCTCECLSCQTDSECDDGSYCDGGSCVAPSCESDAECPGDQSCTDEGVCVATSPTYRFVLIEGVSDNVVEPFPGSDIDAVGLIKREDSAVSVWLDSIDEAYEGSGVRNDAASPTAILGAPDADCDAEAIDRFYSLGGRGSYIIGNFGSACDPAAGATLGCIEDGDSIRVVELGNAECGRYEDDDYDVAVSVSTSDGTFIEVGSATGSAIVPVFGLR